MPIASEEATAVFDSPPPIPSASVLRRATLAVGHFHSVLARGAEWWGDKRARAVERPAAAAGASLELLAAAPEVPVDPGGGDAPSAGGTGLGGLGERTGRGSSVWANARGGGGGSGGGGGGIVNALEGEGGSRKRDRSTSFGIAGKSSGSLSSGIAEGAGAGAGGKVGVAASVMSSLDEFHASPRLKFQLLLREQGIIVTLFDAMETVRPRRKLQGCGSSCKCKRGILQQIMCTAMVRSGFSCTRRTFFLWGFLPGS